MTRQSRLRVFIGAFGDAGHAFPAIALAAHLRARGHEVALETWTRWQAHVEAHGIRFHAAPEYQVFPTRERPLKPYEAAVRAALEGLQADFGAMMSRMRRLRDHELGYEPERLRPDWPSRVVAKTHHSDTGAIAFEGMNALWGSPLRTDPRVEIAEPLAYVPDLEVLVQGWISADSVLKERLRSSPALDDAGLLGAALERTGLGLAALHDCGVGATREITWRDAFAQAQQQLARIAAWFPETKDVGDEILGRLDALAGRRAPQPVVPSHGSFLPGQVLLRRSDVAFIDFDPNLGLSFGAGVLTMLAWSLWNRRRRDQQS